MNNTKMENQINECLKNSFVSGFGIASEFPFIDFAKINDVEIYRLWIDSDWSVSEIKFDTNYNDDQIEVLKLNELRNLETKSINLSDQNDLRIEFDENRYMIISGNPKDREIIEPMRLYKINPENATIWISERK